MFRSSQDYFYEGEAFWKEKTADIPSFQSMVTLDEPNFLFVRPEGETGELFVQAVFDIFDQIDCYEETLWQSHEL